jgi:hypothetical protein
MCQESFVKFPLVITKQLSDHSSNSSRVRTLVTLPYHAVTLGWLAVIKGLLYHMLQRLKIACAYI